MKKRTVRKLRLFRETLCDLQGPAPWVVRGGEGVIASGNGAGGAGSCDTGACCFVKIGITTN